MVWLRQPSEKYRFTKFYYMVKPGLGRIHFLVDEDGCKGSWGNIGVMYVFIYVVKKTC